MTFAHGTELSRELRPQAQPRAPSFPPSLGPAKVKATTYSHSWTRCLPVHVHKATWV